MDEATRQKIVKMYREGKRTADITKATGAPRSSIYFVLNEAGVTPNRNTGPRSGLPRGTELAPQEHQRLLDWALARVTELEAQNGELRARLQAARDVLAR